MSGWGTAHYGMRFWRRVIVRGDDLFPDRLFRFWRGRDWLGADGIGDRCRRTSSRRATKEHGRGPVRPLCPGFGHNAGRPDELVGLLETAALLTCPTNTDRDPRVLRPRPGLVPAA